MPLKIAAKICLSKQKIQSNLANKHSRKTDKKQYAPAAFTAGA